MPPWRLPEVDGDDGQWGDILNQYLNKEHYNNDNGGVGDAASGGHMKVTVRAGTTAAGTAPLKFTTGPLMTAAEAGAVEFLTSKLYYTTTTPARKIIAAYDEGSPGTTGDIFYRDSNGDFARLGIGSPTNVLTVSGSNLPSWVAPTTGLTQQQVMAISSMRI